MSRVRRITACALVLLATRACASDESTTKGNGCSRDCAASSGGPPVNACLSVRGTERCVLTCSSDADCDDIFYAGGCSDTDDQGARVCATSAVAKDAGADATVDAVSDAESACDRASAAFEDFVAANATCTIDADCVIVGDCGPNADFTPVRADAAAEAQRLMDRRCVGAFDGPTYVAVCTGGSCALEATGSECGMPEPDAG